MKRYIYGISYTALLIAFTVYLLLDTFVIARVYESVPLKNNQDSSFIQTEESNDIYSQQSSAYNSSDNSSNNSIGDNALYNGDSQTVSENSSISEQLTDEIKITDNYYSDGNITITLTNYRRNNTTIYVADVKLSSAEYLKTALAKNSYGRNITAKTSETAKNSNAILAINGDYYGAREKGYVLRNGVLYRETAKAGQEDLVIYKNGSFDIINENNISAKDLLNSGAEQILSFGPALVQNGTVAVTEDEEVGKAMSSNPRTAIGIIDNLHYVLVVSDGRTNESDGLSLRELAEFMKGLNVTTAYNLDGGGSSTMYFNGKVINNPTTNGKTIKERSVSDIVYIGY